MRADTHQSDGEPQIAPNHEETQFLLTVTGFVAVAAAAVALDVAHAEIDVLPTHVASLFAGPAHAQDCTDSDGDPRECTATETHAQCISNAQDAYKQCGQGKGLPGKAFCWFLLQLDGLACNSDFFEALSPAH